MKTAKVRERKRDADGYLKGTSHNDIMFDTRAYIVEFPDGAEAEYTANIIAENMYAQCNISLAGHFCRWELLFIDAGGSGSGGVRGGAEAPPEGGT